MMRDYMWDIMNDRTSGWGGKCLGLFLKACAYIYMAAVVLVCWLYGKRVLPSYNLGRPTICVGNITMGGTGKTPVVQWVVSYLKSKGVKPVILTRGYMAQPKSGDAPFLSDEAALLSESLKVPVVIDKSRRRGAERAIKDFEVDVFVMDDGFQHWQARRDLDIVVINATNPFGNGEVLPRGILREPLSALGRAHIFVLNKVDVANDQGEAARDVLAKRFPHIPIAAASYVITGYQDLEGHALPVSENGFYDPVFVVSSIGDPESFKRMLMNQSVTVAACRCFPDHYAYTKKDIGKIVEEMQKSGVRRVLTTHKDAVKLKCFQTEFQNQNMECWVVLIHAVINHGKKELYSRINSICPA